MVRDVTSTLHTPSALPRGGSHLHVRLTPVERRKACEGSSALNTGRLWAPANEGTDRA